MTGNVLESIEKVLSAVEFPERHTLFQMKNFIIGKEPTIQGKLWQIVRELRARKDNLESLQEQVEDTEDNISLLKLERFDETPQGKILERKKQRKINSTQKALKRTQQQIKYIEEEVSFLLEAYHTLSSQQPMKPLDDIESQKEYWNEKLLEEFNLRMLIGKPLDTEFVKTVLAIDNDIHVKVQMISMLENTYKKSRELNK